MDREHPRGAGQCWLTAWPTAMRLTVLAAPDILEQIEAWPVKTREVAGGLDDDGDRQVRLDQQPFRPLQPDTL